MTLFQEATAAMAKITIVIQMPQHCITHTTVRISFGSKIDLFIFISILLIMSKILSVSAVGHFDPTVLN